MMPKGELTNIAQRLFDKIDTLSVDMGIIKATLKGNGVEGVCGKTDRHEKEIIKLNAIVVGACDETNFEKVERKVDKLERFSWLVAGGWSLTCILFTIYATLRR